MKKVVSLILALFILILVTIVKMLIQAYTPSLYTALGAFIDLIVVNCIILGRAEAFAAKNGPVASFFDGLGSGIGFTLMDSFMSNLEVRKNKPNGLIVHMQKVIKG